ncbi:MAG: right-handed parallel beta-helix repeat-containing protein [Phycisphaerales bacterium]|nr:right-handed parallel beta-helix repeat-containing protein [Phycisphaerales bacterium]
MREFIIVVCLAAAACGQPVAESPTSVRLPEVIVTKDDTEIDRSCTVVIPAGTVIVDVAGDGAIKITKSGVVVEFAPGSVLRGAGGGVDADQMMGIGIRIESVADVVIRRAEAEGYKAGIYASAAPRLTIESTDVSGNFRQRLRSTPAAEDQSDWLWPHRNDGNEWLTNYGAGIYIEDSDGVTVKGCRAREGQNGLVIDRVNDGRIYDNDFSFLSGWGLAMWRSSGNTITRNATDFCIRGYSHGVYNRGQDSAGILMFEQCSRNIIAENSATHGGDGVFAFGGHEALGETPPPGGDAVAKAAFDYTGRGCNENLFWRNDFSYAAAHGLELTFSFDNRIIGNRLSHNNICGIWGGYSQRTLIEGNEINENGPGAPAPSKGGEGGGINIEHGHANRIVQNDFGRNSVGLSLWWDDDAALFESPWGKANYKGSSHNELRHNRFAGSGVRLRKTTETTAAQNVFIDVDPTVHADAESAVKWMDAELDRPPSLEVEMLGESKPVGARKELWGREQIIMGEWGPWDHQSVLVREAGSSQGATNEAMGGVVYLVHGARGAEVLSGGHKGIATTVLPSEEDGGPIRVVISPRREGAGDVAGAGGVYAYDVALRVTDSGGAASEHQLRGKIVATEWLIGVWRSPVDPREDLEAWRAGAKGMATARWPGALRLSLGHGGPRGALKGKVDEATLAALPEGSHYGLLAATRMRLPAGAWKFSVLSDDGVRVRVRAAGSTVRDGVVVVENWTHHGPERNEGVYEQKEGGAEVVIEVEYFQLDGYAVLEVELERLE